MDAIRGLMDFIDASPTAFHAVENICAALADAGWQRLEERETWQIAPGGRYYFTRNRSSVIAFRVPEAGFAHFQITASHSDSPCFKLKPGAARDAQGCAVLNVEPYGGMLMATWLDRPLSVAGRLVVSGKDGLETRLANVDRNLALIPNVPIHFNRDANKGVEWNPQVDLLPVVGAEGADILTAAAESAGVKKEDVAGSDLFLYNRDRATLWGNENEFLAAPRLDDLECAYAGLQALLEARPSKHIDMLCVFDNEEVGSGTKQGADSSLLAEALRRIALALGAAGQALEAAVAGSFMLSADNAHAVHPNHPEYSDGQNHAFMNEGIVIKYNASQRYTTDGVSEAVFRHICQRAGVPTQVFANRSDLAGGGTLGNISASHVSISTVDIGLAQLAMHSCYETAGVKDIDYMINGMKAFYETDIECAADGEYKL